MCSQMHSQSTSQQDYDITVFHVMVVALEMPKPFQVSSTSDVLIGSDLLTDDPHSETTDQHFSLTSNPHPQAYSLHAPENVINYI